MFGIVLRLVLKINKFVAVYTIKAHKESRVIQQL